MLSSTVGRTGMATTAAFFVGEGENARFLGGHYSDGYIQETGDEQGEGIPPSLLMATTEEEFKKLVAQHMKKVSKDDRMEVPSWSEARGVQYIYCFLEGHVWVTNGGRWYNDYISGNIHPSKKTPSAPVNQIGKLGIDVKVQCGQCQYVETLDHKEFDKIDREECTMAEVYAYFESKGWKGTKDQGWLCGDCAQ